RGSVRLRCRSARLLTVTSIRNVPIATLRTANLGNSTPDGNVQSSIHCRARRAQRPIRRRRSGLGRLEDRRSLDWRGERAKRGADELDAPGALVRWRQVRPAARMAEAMAADDAIGPDLDRDGGEAGDGGR